MSLIMAMQQCNKCHLLWQNATYYGNATMALAKSIAESIGSTRFLVYPNVETSGFLQK